MVEPVQQFDVISMGRIGVDLYPLRSGAPLARAESFGKSLGGPAADVAIAAAGLGRSTPVITRTGPDPFGTCLHQSLTEVGVDNRRVTPVEGCPTPSPSARPPRRTASRCAPVAAPSPRPGARTCQGIPVRRSRRPEPDGSRSPARAAPADPRPDTVPASAVPVDPHGAGHRSRQIDGLGAAGVFACDRSIAAEVLTTHGDRPSFPPRRHDEHQPGEEPRGRPIRDTRAGPPAVPRLPLYTAPEKS